MVFWVDMVGYCREKEKKRCKIEELTDDNWISTGQFEFLMLKWTVLEEQNGKCMFSNILCVVDSNFNCFKHFVEVQNV